MSILIFLAITPLFFASQINCYSSPIAVIPVNTRTQTKTGISLTKPFMRVWQNNMTPMKIVKSKKYLILENENNLFSINALNGSILWKSFYGNISIMYPSKNEDFLFCSTSNLISNNKIQYTLTAINFSTGVTGWSQIFSKKIIGLNDSITYLSVLLEDGSYKEINKTDGSVLLSRKLSISSGDKVTFLENLIISNNDKELTAFNIYLNIPVWTEKTGFTTNIYLQDDKRLFYQTNNRTIKVVNANNGKAIWEKDFRVAIQRMIPLQEGLIILTNENSLIFVDNRGKQKWKRIIDDKTSTNYLVKDYFILLFPNGSNTGLVIDIRNGQIKNKIQLNEDHYLINPPIIVGNNLILPTIKGLIALTSY